MADAIVRSPNGFSWKRRFGMSLGTLPLASEAAGASSSYPKIGTLVGYVGFLLPNVEPSRLRDYVSNLCSSTVHFSFPEHTLHWSGNLFKIPQVS